MAICIPVCAPKLMDVSNAARAHGDMHSRMRAPCDLWICRTRAAALQSMIPGCAELLAAQAAAASAGGTIAVRASSLGPLRISISVCRCMGYPLRISISVCRCMGYPAARATDSALVAAGGRAGAAVAPPCARCVRARQPGPGAQLRAAVDQIKPNVLTSFETRRPCGLHRQWRAGAAASVGRSTCACRCVALGADNGVVVACA